MKVSYNGLWKILIDKNMKKKNWHKPANYLLQLYLKWAEESLLAWMFCIVSELN